MRKLFSGSLWILMILLAAGCHKDIKESKSAETDVQSKETNGRNPDNECRLTDLTIPWASYQYHYNRKGLADEWNISEYGLFKQEYDREGTLKKSRLYISGELINTIYFFYNRKGDPVKETWYYEDTDEKYDEVIYSYNRAGQMVRGESFIGDYYTITHYTNDGNVLDWSFYVSGSPYMSGHYKYIRRYTNPYLAVPGIEYGFPFINQTINYDKWWPTAEKIISYGEDGSAMVIQDFDPVKTTWQEASHNYPASATYFDRITTQWVPYTFEYENCGGHGHGGHGDDKSINAASSGLLIINKNSKKAKVKMILTFGKDITEKVFRNKE